MTDVYHAIRALSESPLLQTIRRELDTERLLQDAVAVQQIPAPTFDEAQRATFVEARLQRYPLQDITTDTLHNVYARWPGEDASQPALLVSAHLDTVFPAATDLAVTRDAGRMVGPGLGDNSLGVAGLLALLDVFQQYELRPPVDIWFVANSREEGLGDLGGMRAVWERLGDRLGAAIVLEGMALGHIYHAGIAVRRLHITCTAPGGHSWLNFGQPSAIHALVELGARITALDVPSDPRTTYNIGLINGGRSINSIATQAELYLDLRSEATHTLAALEQQVRDAVAVVKRPRLSWAVEVVGDRPAGRIPVEHPLVQLATHALATIPRPALHKSGSTDANVLLAAGLPAVTVGITEGANAHRTDEYVELGPLADGLWHVLLLVLSAAEQLPGWTAHGDAKP